ncbi:complement decay-accelerating factor isoform X5 [Tachyglossus aculeatus]|uniref:complement decay-accelerating factor isoform X5 n=1 Tax=Tachyglossus aculeatus TaxID=9261 RepID=UPI0018F6AD6F|nr:complement decay-accelerating factor isoform X5 [Tachyglossus aculeatus]
MSPNAPRLPPLLLLLLPPLLLLPLPPAARGDCPEPPEIPNAHPLLPDPPEFPTGTSLTYSCNKGFVKIPEKSNSVVCLENDQWSASTEFCNRSCDVPPTLRFASLKSEYRTQNYFPVSSVVEYECRPGYKRDLSLSPNLTCLENLLWSKVPDFCIRKQCPSPPDLPNGQVHITDILFGSVILFSCNEGYKLIGEHSSTCELVDQTLAWSNSHPDCAPILCPSPPNIANGSWQRNENDEYPAGASVPYACNRGFSLVGNRDLVCGNDGNWSSPPPECKVVSCENPVVQDGVLENPSKPPYSYETTLIFSCKPGFTLEGSAKITCDSNSKWTPDPPKCLKKGFCENPVVKNGHVVEQSSPPPYLYQATLRFNCSAGFTMEGNPRIRCENGNWIPPPPLCRKTPTSPPLTIKEPPTTTKESPTTTKEPPTTTKEPPTTTKEPPTTSKESPTTAKELSSAIRELPMTTRDLPSGPRDSSSAPRDPSSTTREPPSATAEPPSATTEPPLTTTEPPLATTEPPLATTEPPSASRESPLDPREPTSATGESPLATGEPSLTPKEPASATREPLLATREPPTTPRKPPVTTREPPTTPSEAPTTIVECPVTTKEPSTTTKKSLTTKKSHPSTTTTKKTGTTNRGKGTSGSSSGQLT